MTDTHKLKSNDYRSDLDGLRALAITGVLIYHADKTLLPGGFLGVDVFLVLSGFLIGKILLAGLSTGDISGKKFFIRRVRRLAPAFIIVMFATSFAAYLIFSPRNLAQFAEYSLFALIGLSNMRFVFGDSYFEMSPETNPLLHTWSLGLEEQFYAMALILILVFARFKVSRRAISWVLLSAGVISLTTALVTPFFFSDQLNFFWLPSRAWEFVAGMLLATEAGRALIERGIPHSQFLATTGLVLVAGSFVLMGELADGPGLASLPTVCGSALLVAFGTQSNVGKMLGFRPIAYFGLISYGLYLWHYPILAFGRVLYPNSPLVTWLVLLPLAIGLATATYHFVESPVRWGSHPKRFGAILLPLALLLPGVSVASLATGGLPSRLSGMPEIESKTLEEGPHLHLNGSEGSPVLLVGDSHMAALGPGVIDLLRGSDGTVASYHHGACPLLLDMELAHEAKLSVSRGCDTRLQVERLNWIDSFGPSTVVLLGRWSALLENQDEYRVDDDDFDYFFRYPGTRGYSPETSADQVIEGLENTIKVLESRGHSVVLVYPIPESEAHIPETLMRHFFLSGRSWPLPEPLVISQEEFTRQSATATRVLDSVEGTHLERVYPADVLCNLATPTANGDCATHTDTEILYYDSNHLSVAGAKLVAPEVVEAIGRADSGSR